MPDLWILESEAIFQMYSSGVPGAGPHWHLSSVSFYFILFRFHFHTCPPVLGISGCPTRQLILKSFPYSIKIWVKLVFSDSLVWSEDSHMVHLSTGVIHSNPLLTICSNEAPHTTV